MKLKSWDLVHHTPRRADYGKGVFVRTIVLTCPEPGRILAGLEDGGHAFQLEMRHQDGVITSVQAQWLRQPFSNCGGSVQVLQQAVGQRLNNHLLAVMHMCDPRQQCTHQYDLLCLAVLHAQLQREDRRYDVVMPDAGADDLVHTTLYCNGQTVLQWQVQDYERIEHPAECQGVSTLKGFTQWVQQNVAPAEHEYFFIMQRALFVAQMQMLDMASMVGKPAAWSGPPVNSCFGSQPVRFETSVRVDGVRKYSTENKNDWLSFLPNALPFGPM